MKRRPAVLTAASVLLLLLLVSGRPDISLPSECYNISEVVNRGNSMEPVLQDGQGLKVLEGYYVCNPVRRGDIIVYDSPSNDVPIVKFVRALPGDSLRFDGCNLLRNGEVLRNSEGEPYCFTGSRKEMIGLYTGDSIDGFLLLGNDPGGSLDSTRFGLVSEEGFVGKVRLE